MTKPWQDQIVKTTREIISCGPHGDVTYPAGSVGLSRWAGGTGHGHLELDGDSIWVELGAFEPLTPEELATVTRALQPPARAAAPGAKEAQFLGSGT
jgi:hypothetical protein